MKSGLFKNQLFKVFILIIFVFLLYLPLIRRPSAPLFSPAARVNHVIVVSVDALNAGDYEQLQQLANFRTLMDNGLFVKEVTGVYPSLTYPAHATMISGVYPIKHGIIANTINQPGISDPDWYWFYKDIKVPTLWDYAKKSNMTVGALFWPVSAGADIDYNLPEIWPNEAGQNQTWMVLKNGTPGFILDVYLRFSKMLDGKKQPNLDNFTTQCAAYIIKKKQPHLLFIHLTDLDHARHANGVFSDEARASLERQNYRLGQIIDAAKTAGIYEDTAFVVLGDHGFLDTRKCININAAFKNAGLISIDQKGKLTAWKVYANSCDGSAHVYLHDKNDQATRAQVEKILKTMEMDPNTGIDRVYDNADAIHMEVSGQIDYILEARRGYYFKSNLDGDLITDIDAGLAASGDQYLATHGYSYSKAGYRTVFMAAGQGIAKNKVIPSMNLTDVAPTIGAMLGIKLDAADGRIIDMLSQ